MLRVGVAGGTGGLGRTIVEHIANTQLYAVYVLTRSATGVIGRRGIQALVLDYSSPAAIAAVLRAEHIDTVISVIGILSEDDHQAQLNLIDGAAQSGTVTRFAPSEYGWDYEEALKHGFPPTIPGLGEYRPAAFKAAAAARLRGTAGLRWTRVVSGLLMDFFGHPHQPAPGFPVAVALDVENARAAIPGDGNAGVVLTHSADVGAFVARLLGLREWPERCFVVGDRLTWNEALVWAERARGQMFDMRYDAVDDLKQGRVTELPANVQRYSVVPKQLLDGLFCVWGIAFVEGWFDFPEDTLKELFPDMRPRSFADLMRACWAGRGDRELARPV
ncbi:Cytochrome P450 [Neofusicoccum parvum]|uniref:Cytochrome P450 n=1 Tax=Neofusicoccum parvum TaxID=310453 RepID=A0ACB5SNI1_9PEZI|nr:Cytochrome P450 [Neofusicoccum parvum]GME49327.1 Cytochrome P450 [Neofusicoccum parvum]